MGIIYDAITVDTLPLVIKQVNSSIFEDRTKMAIYKGTTRVESLTIEAVLDKRFPTLIGIHPLCPLPECQPDITFVSRRTHEALQF